MLVGLCLLLMALTPCSLGTHKVIFISFDGFRHDYLDMAEAQKRNISAFKQIREAGFQAEVQNVMITLTFPSHYAMATGRHVENHGLVGNKFYDPDLKKSFDYTKSERNVESVWFEYGDAEPLWLTNERHGGRSCVFQWVGSEARVHKRMAFATAGIYNSKYSLRYRVDRILDWISRDEFNLAMLYYPEPDSSGHRHGPDSVEVMRAIEEINDALAYLLQRIDQTPSLKGKVNLVISSDHGMTAVDPKNRVIELHSLLEGVEAITVVSGATLSLWLNTTTSLTAQKVYNLLHNASRHLKVYLKEDIPERYHYRNNPRIAPVHAIADIGWLINTQKSQYKDKRGMHGYDNAEPDMHPFMVAMGPDVQPFTERQRFHQIDLYPYICAMLGLDKPNKIDGLIDRVLPYLRTQPSEDFLKKFRLYASGTLAH